MDKHAIQSVVIAITALLLAPFAALRAAEAPARSAKPNIVLIISDDHAWTDYSFMGHPRIATPALDKFARQSLTFTRGYVPSSLCCPSLASIITGRYPHQHKITSNDPPIPAGMAPQDFPRSAAYKLGRDRMNAHMDAVETLPRLLVKHGYLALQTGKWWQGDYTHGGFTHGMTKGGRHGDEGLDIGRKTMQPIYDFIAEAKRDDKPFFVWYAPMMPHAPHTPPKRLFDKYLKVQPNPHIARYWAMVEWFDETCGDLLKHLQDRKLADNTIVAYVADNGWIQSSENPQYAAKSKQSPYDGGLRTPIMVRYPPKLKPRMSDTPVMSLDLFPTILKLADIAVPQGVAGIDLADETQVKSRPSVQGEIFTHNSQDLDRPVASLRWRWMLRDGMKLLVPTALEKNAAVELYDVIHDPNETKNFAGEKPQLVKELTAALDAWWPISAAAEQSAPAAAPPGTSRSKPRNVVLLYADDWRHDTLGIAGNPIVRTPHLDQLSRDGFRFTRHCVTTSICGVSRASMLTGQWMSKHGNRAFDAFKTPWAETFPGLLRANGYFVGHVGKWHCGRFPKEQFDFGRSYAGTHWLKQPNGTSIHVTKKNESDAIEFLRTHSTDKPFCLTVAFFATHAEDGNPKQYLPQPESMALYRDAKIPMPKTATEEQFRRLPPFIANDKNESRNRWRWRFDTSEKYQEMMKNYYRLATEVDAACGSVLAELKRQSLLDDTLVIFTTDNGYFHAEHGLADKWYPYEESIRVPLIVLDPRMPVERRGGTNDDLTLNVDIAPTILAATGIQPPRGMQGRDLAPLYLSNERIAWRSDFFYEHATIKNKEFIPASQALVTKDWKYLLWPEFDYEQLFDLRTDRAEEHDVARDPAHAPQLAAMRKRFAELKALAAGETR